MSFNVFSCFLQTSISFWVYWASCVTTDKYVQPSCSCCALGSQTSHRVENRASSRALCFFCGENGILKMVDILGIQKTTLKCVRDFGFVLRKCSEGSVFCAAIFCISVFRLMLWLCQVHEPNLCCHCTSTVTAGAKGTSTSLCFKKGVKAVYPHMLRSVNHVCKFNDVTTPNPHPNPTCYVASNMCASSTMSLHPTPPQPRMLRSTKHVCKIKTRNINRETCTSVRHTCASERPRACVKNQSNYVARDMREHSRNVHIYRRRCTCVASIMCARSRRVTSTEKHAHP